MISSEGLDNKPNRHFHMNNPNGFNLGFSSLNFQSSPNSSSPSGVSSVADQVGAIGLRSSSQNAIPSVNDAKAGDTPIPNPMNRSDSLENTITTTNNNMNSKVNKRLDRIPENLGPNGTTPSGKPRLFVCTVCTRAFARHEHLKRHERSHTKEKPFSCGVCQRKFSRRDLLLRHAQKLHAGCDDAIKRLRRRSIRSKSVSSPSNKEILMADEMDVDSDPKAKRQKVFNEGDSGDGENSQLLTPSVSSNNTNLLFSNSQHPPHPIHSVSHGNIFSNTHSGIGASDFKGRRSSFSAASASNYASVPQSQLRNNYYQDSVEFSTPQLLPVENLLGSDNLNHQSINTWLSDINALPGLDFLNNFSLNDSQQQQQQQKELDNSVTPSSLLSDSKVSSTGSRPKRQNVARRSQSRKSSTTNLKQETDIFGYSFYDDDYTLANQHDEFQDMKFSYPKLPSSYLKEYSSSSPDGSNSNNLNDYELLSELEIPNHEEKILAAGYSFYGSNDFAPSTMSPANMFNLKSENDTSAMDIDSHKDFSNHHENQNQQNGENDQYAEDLSSETLFTENLKSNIEKVLSKYPFVNIPPPDLPQLDTLNSFCQIFKEKFLSHYPFIHSSILNEKTMYQYTKNDDSPNDLTSNVCLPLLIATTGSLYSNNKKISADLYEISRRCIHVYLDLRKKTDDAEKATTHNSPLWLVQCLILSVLYGLFAEYDESDLSIILRQVNALCTLIKVSKFTSLKFENENIEINEDYFKEYILYQSKIRTVFMIFNISSTLTCFYDLTPFIKYKEIKCDLPDLENYWTCSNVEEFKQKCVENSSLNYCLNLEKILNDMLMNNQINYKMSEFGANIVVFGLLQYFYSNKKNSLTNFSAGVSPYHSNSSNLVKNYKWEDLLIDQNLNINLESILLKNISVIRSLMIDLSKVKECMWHRRWSEMSQEFIRIHPRNDDLIDACDYSIRTISLIFINDIDSSNFKKCLSLTLQCLFFNFFYIAKFLHSFERRILKSSASALVIENMKPSELKLISKNFSIYIKIAKFLADLEQILVRNFNYHDIESKLATKEFDETRYNFGVPPRLLNESDYTTNINMTQVSQVAKLCLSSSILKIGEFVFNLVFEKEMNFNIYKSLSDGLFHLRVYLESDLQQK